MILPVVEHLAKSPLRQVFDFADILSHKLYLLDGEKFAGGDSAVLGDPDFVADRFLYARCCAVANGREFFNHIRKEPAEMSVELLFAPLLRIPGEAFFRQTGKKMNHVWAWPIETFSNPAGWPNHQIERQNG